MQLVAYGAQDVYLSGNPQITFFKVVYRRHTNFAMESIEQTFNGDPDFGRKVNCVLSRNGDLVNNLYLQATFPIIADNPNGNWTGWCNSLGHSLIKTIEIEIGGQKIDKHYGEWLDIWDELFNQNKQELIYKFKSDKSCRGLNKKAFTLYIPLQFWFCRNPGLALPLIALQYHEVKVNVELRELKELIKSDVAYTNPVGSLTDCSLWVDYIYLDTDERRRFAQVSHEYLIEQLQFNGDETIKDTDTAKNCMLTFNHPIKELVWAMVTDTNGSVNAATGNNWNKFSGNKGNDTFTKAKLQLNGHDRFIEREATYFRNVQPYQYHSKIPSKYIYSYSFGLKPEEHQPSGTCNFSRIDNANLHLTLPTQEGNRKIKIFGINYNILRVMSGMGGLAYSN